MASAWLQVIHTERGRYTEDWKSTGAIQGSEQNNCPGEN